MEGFLKSKAETPEEFVVLFKMIQTKLNQVIFSIRYDHGTVFENQNLINSAWRMVRVIIFLLLELLNKIE